MMLYCRLLGAVLLVCTGFAAGQAYCQRLWTQWRAVCGFERLLTYLADQLAFCALPSAELLQPGQQWAQLLHREPQQPRRAAQRKQERKAGLVLF